MTEVDAQARAEPPARARADAATPETRLGALLEEARGALGRGAVGEARRLADQAYALDEGVWRDPRWSQLRDERAWPDAWLVAAARQEAAEVPALDALVERYWAALFGRCQLLTLDRQLAADLAQDAWLRVVRARRSLDPAGNFPGYLTTIATNIWRDRHRAARRAGPLADRHLAALDAPSDASDDGPALGVTMPDPHTLGADDQLLVALDVDRALARLDPRARDVLVARFVAGESCAEIGRRYGRTEQTVSGWVRQASREMRDHLGERP